MVGLSEAQLQEEMLAALKVSVFPATAAACAEVCMRHIGALRGEMMRVKQGQLQVDTSRGYQQHSRGARSASPLMRALDFTRSTDNLASTASMETIPHEAKLVVHRVRQAVLRSGHSHEQVFHRFCRAGGGDALAPLMTWSDFLRVIETFERDLEPSVVVRLWQVLVPGGASGMDFASFKQWFCQDDNALKITQEIGNFSFTSELNAFSRLMEPAPAAEWRPMGGRPPLSPLFAPGGRQSFGPDVSPKRLSSTLPVPLKDAMAMEAEVARRAEEQRLVQQVSDAAYRVEEERAARRAAEAEVETLRRAEEQRREEDRSRRHAEVEALQREAAQRQAQHAADRRAEEERARKAAEAQSQLPSPQVSQVPSSIPPIPKPLTPAQPPQQQLPPPLPSNPQLPQLPSSVPQQPQGLPQSPPLPQQPPQSLAPPGQPLPQSPPLPQQPPLQPSAFPQLPPAPLPQSPPLPQQAQPQMTGATQFPQQPTSFPQRPPGSSLPQTPPLPQPPAFPQQPPAPLPQPAGLPQSPPLPQQPPAPLPQSPPLPLAPTASQQTSAAPQSGQTAPMDASGLAGVVASGKDMDVQAFVGRLVNHLGYKIAPGKFSTLTQLASEWATQVRQYNCVVESIKPIFENVTARIRQDSQTPGSWVTGGAALPQPQLPSSPPAPGPLAPTPLGQQPPPLAPFGAQQRPPLGPVGAPPLQPLSAGTAPAPLPQSPPQSLAPPGVPAPLAPLGGVPPPTPGTSSPPLPLQPLGMGTSPAPLAPAPLQPWTAGTAPAPLVPAPLQPLTPGTAPAPLAPAPLQPLGAPPAPTPPAPLAPVGSPFQPLAPTSPMGPPAPLAPLGVGSSATPQSGQTAPLDVGGFAGVVAGGKDMDVQAFIGRLVHHLGCKIAPGKYSTLSQLAGEWALQARQQNCVVDNVRPLYDNMVARIKQDSQTPGSWVTGPASSSQAPSMPTPLQPLSAGSLQPLAPLQPLTSSPPATTPSPSPLAPLGSTPAPLAPLGAPLQPLAPTPSPSSPLGAPAPLAPTPLAPLAPPGAQPNAMLPPQQPLGGGASAAPQSGQTAPLEASGFAAACASGKDADVQAFVGRLVYHLGCKIAPGKYGTLSQLAGEWAAQVRQQNCVVSSSSSIYDSMVSRIKGDAQSPGSWVTATAPQQASPSQPTPLQPLQPFGNSLPLPASPPQSFQPLPASPPQPLSSPLPLSPPPPTAPLGAPSFGQSDSLTIPASAPVDKNSAAAQRKAELDAKMKARAQEAADKRAAAKARAEALKAGNAPLA